MITIKIDTDNAAFEDGDKWAEVARILARFAADYGRFRKLYDLNGNVVGTAVCTGKDRER